MHWTCCEIADFSPQALEQAYARLSPSRKEHIDRFLRPVDRSRSLAAEIMVQQLLQEHYGVTGTLHRKENGQPYLTGCDVFVSISHSGDKIACAISKAPVGIDIERIRPIKWNLVQQVCVDEEKDYVLAGQELDKSAPCYDTEILARFFEIWTAKEAYFKKIGTGITDLKSVNTMTFPRDVHRVDDYILQIL